MTRQIIENGITRTLSPEENRGRRDALDYLVASGSIGKGSKPPQKEGDAKIIEATSHLVNAQKRRETAQIIAPAVAENYKAFPELMKGLLNIQSQPSARVAQATEVVIGSTQRILGVMEKATDNILAQIARTPKVLSHSETITRTNGNGDVVFKKEVRDYNTAHATLPSVGKLPRAAVFESTAIAMGQTIASASRDEVYVAGHDEFSVGAAATSYTVIESGGDIDLGSINYD